MLDNNNQYLSIIETIKNEIGNSQYKAAVSVNRELIMLYCSIGLIINEHKEWSNKFIENLARDIKLEFPNMTGYFVRNLKYMSKFASEYPDKKICADSVCTNFLVTQLFNNGQNKRFRYKNTVY